MLLGSLRKLAGPRGHSGYFHPRLEGLEDRCLPSTVTNLADAGLGSLREAIATTEPGGVVDFEPGLAGAITLTTGTLTIAKDLTITGPGADVITVSGNRAVTVFSISRTFSVVISGLTVAEGRSFVGGGIVNGGALTLTDCVLSGNFAGEGGGIRNNGRLTITHSTLSGNSARNGGGGGAISNSGTLTVTDSTLSGNIAFDRGGAIWNYVGGRLTVTHSTLSGNSTFFAGGGIFNSFATLTLTDSTVSDNAPGGIWNEGTSNIARSTLSGNSEFQGGITNSAGTLTVTDSTISGSPRGVYVERGMVAILNSTLSGGGIINLAGTLTVTDSTLSGGGITNSAGTSTVTDSTIRGSPTGAINNQRDGMLTVIHSTLTDNTSNNGGAIINLGTLSVTDSTLSGNTVLHGGGGGIFNSGTLILTSSTLSGNTADFFGGGIWNFGTLTVTNSTFSGNTAGVGGGIANFGSLMLTHSTLSGNTASDGGGIAVRIDAVTQVRNTIIAGNFADSSPDVSGRLNSQGHNLIGDGSGGGGFRGTDQVGTSDQPIDPQLEPLGEYGGPTLTQRPLPSSPAVDAGDNSDAPDTDQRGLPRIVNDIIDIGAVELQPEERGRASRTAPLRITPEFPAWEQRADSRFSALGTDAPSVRSGLRSSAVAGTDAAPAHEQAIASHDPAGHGRPELPERHRVCDRLFADWDVGFFAGQAGTS